MQDEERYDRLRQQNDNLKQTNDELQQRVKKSNWEAQFYKKKNKGGQRAPQSKEAAREQRELADLVGELRKENTRFKAQLRKRSDSVRRRRSQRDRQDRKTGKRRSSSAGKGGKKPKRRRSSTARPGRQDIVDMINEIRTQFAEERQSQTQPLGSPPAGSFHSPAASAGVPYAFAAGASASAQGMQNSDLAEVRRELREKKTAIARLTVQFQKLEANFKADKIIQQRALQQCDEYKRLLREADDKHRQLRAEMAELDMRGDQTEALRLLVTDMQAENKTLRDQVTRLGESAFLGDRLEAKRIKQVEEECKFVVVRKQQELVETQEEARLLKSKLEDALEQLEDAKGRAERAETETKEGRFKLRMSEQESKTLTSRLDVFTQESGVDPKELEAALEMVRRSRAPPDNVDFLDKGKRRMKPGEMRNRIDELELLNKELIVECKNMETLLQTQVDLNKALKEQETVRVTELDRFRERLTLQQRQVMAAGQPEMDRLSEASMFSVADINQLNLMEPENLLSFRVTKASLNPRFFGGVDPVTLVVVDFFEFASVTSGTFGGLVPQYDLKCQFKVRMDAFFTQYLETERLTVELVQQKDRELEVVATALVSLSTLLVSPDGRIAGTATLETGSGQNVGSLEYVGKMFRQVLAATATPTPRLDYDGGV